MICAPLHKSAEPQPFSSRNLRPAPDTKPGHWDRFEAELLRVLWASTSEICQKTSPSEVEYPMYQFSPR